MDIIAQIPYNTFIIANVTIIDGILNFVTKYVFTSPVTVPTAQADRKFNKCGEIAKANGLRFAFHNHVDEFHELEGKIPFDVMIENTDKGLVTFQIDTAQLVYGGFKCHDYVNRYPGRFANWHLKDANADGKGSTEMGAGIVDFKSLFAVAEKAGLEDYFIEQERYNMTPLQAMKHDYDFLMNASYVKW